MQYVLRICDADGWLKTSFIVTVENPIPTEIPTGITQVVMTNTTSYEAIISVYAQYTTQAVYSKNGTNIDCTADGNNYSWPID